MHFGYKGVEYMKTPEENLENNEEKQMTKCCMCEEHRDAACSECQVQSGEGEWELNLRIAEEFIRDRLGISSQLCHVIEFANYIKSFEARVRP